MEFSFYTRPISNTLPQRSVTLSETFEWITSDKYEFVTRRIRVASTKEIRQKLKTSILDYVTFSGEFEWRNNNELKTHSGLMVFDFDDLDDVEEVRQTLLNDPSIETALLFRSPSGNGLKWVVPIDLDSATHQEWFEGIANYLKATHGLGVDPSGKDVARACFLCHDPNAYLNPKFSK
ncbi:BT4734/BF3469 family protein [Maribellus sediminis]|uniref:BT4734/BF3469 family protein n=1 Tax=Maribellus sediminis TaxID=2696285 RepID=UPI00143180BB|nr:BT4734/BF3469 family protein [Maribellus sediminis]